MREIPAEDYKNLLKQFYAMRTLIDSLDKRIEYYWRECPKTAALREQLRSEREANAILTKEISKYENSCSRK